MTFITQTQAAELFRRVDAIPELTGAGVGWVGGGSCGVLRKSRHSSGLETFVILEAAPAELVESKQSDPQPGSRLMKELKGAALNCASAGLTAAGSIVAGAATPFTSGGSAVLAYLSGAAAIASALQCGHSIGRTLQEVIDPAANDYLDSEDWLRTTATALDLIQLAGVGAAGGSMLKAVTALRRAGGRGFYEALKGMTRAERKRLASELARQSLGKVSNKALKAAVRAGKFPKIFSQAEVTRGLSVKLLEAVGSAIDVGNSADSGALGALIVHITQE